MNYRWHLVAPALAELVVYEVECPDMVRMRGPKACDRAVLLVEPFALLLSLWKLRPFLTLELLDFLAVHIPAFDTKELGDLSIAIAPLLLRQSNDHQSQRIIVALSWLILQAAPHEADYPARPLPKLGGLLAGVNDSLTILLNGQAQGFRWIGPALRVSLSSSRSVTIFCSRVDSIS